MSTFLSKCKTNLYYWIEIKKKKKDIPIQLIQDAIHKSTWDQKYQSEGLTPGQWRNHRWHFLRREKFLSKRYSKPNYETLKLHCCLLPRVTIQSPPRAWQTVREDRQGVSVPSGNIPTAAGMGPMGPRFLDFEGTGVFF